MKVLQTEIDVLKQFKNHSNSLQKFSILLFNPNLIEDFVVNHNVSNTNVAKEVMFDLFQALCQVYHRWKQTTIEISYLLLFHTDKTGSHICQQVLGFPDESILRKHMKSKITPILLNLQNGKEGISNLISDYLKQQNVSGWHNFFASIETDSTSLAIFRMFPDGNPYGKKYIGSLTKEQANSIEFARKFGIFLAEEIPEEKETN